MPGITCPVAPGGAGTARAPVPGVPDNAGAPVEEGGRAPNIPGGTAPGEPDAAGRPAAGGVRPPGIPGGTGAGTPGGDEGLATIPGGPPWPAAPPARPAAGISMGTPAADA